MLRISPDPASSRYNPTMIREGVLASSLDRTENFDDATYAEAMAKIRSDQPELFAFFADSCEELGDSLRGTMFTLFITIYGAFEIAMPDGVPEIASDDIAGALRRYEREFSRRGRGRTQHSQVEVIEPLLTDFVASVFESVLDKSPDTGQAELSNAMIVLQSLIDVLHGADGGRMSPLERPEAPPGRNDPCYCGSGKKYKRCCRDKDNEAAQSKGVSPIHAIDHDLVQQILEFADETGLDPDVVPELFEDEDQIYFPYLAYCAPSGGRTLASRFEEARGWRLNPRQLGWLAAQRESWLSVWEIAGSDPGRSLDLVDLISGEKRTVQEVAGSIDVRKRWALLTRVVDFDGVSVLVGNVADPLGPREAAGVVEIWRRETKPGRKKRIPILRQIESIVLLAELWDEALDDVYASAARGPMITNTDGDEMLFTKEYWSFAPSDRDEIVRRVGALEMSEREHDSDRFVFLEGRSVLGVIDVADDELIVETTSLSRADEMKTLVGDTMGALASWKVRSHVDIAELMRQAQNGAPPEPEPADPEWDAVVREKKEEHYATWPDIPLPGLKDKTPRQAAKSKVGRKKLIPLLKYIETGESSVPEEQRYDVRKLWHALGIDYE